MIHYRKADREDIHILARMRVSMLCEETALTEEYKEELRNNSKQYMIRGLKDSSFMALVAESDGKIVAMSGLTLYILPPNDWCPNGKTAYIGNLFTLPDYRRQGIAAKLFSLMVEEAKNLGCERIQLHATDRGRPIYEKYGFEDSPDSMAYYPFGKKGRALFQEKSTFSGRD